MNKNHTRMMWKLDYPAPTRFDISLCHTHLYNTNHVLSQCDFGAIAKKTICKIYS